jgi:hypothetical protein
MTVEQCSNVGLGPAEIEPLTAFHGNGAVAANNVRSKTTTPASHSVLTALRRSSDLPVLSDLSRLGISKLLCASETMTRTP